MFYYLDGTVSIMEPGLAVLDIGGVGYACYTTANTMSYLEVGKKSRLYTYCNIKEDAFDIYGFHDAGEKRCFEMLLSVSGVGPKAALSILSASTPEKLALAIVNDDEKALTIAPGIGKRIAQRIILELKDKVGKDTSLIKGSGTAVSAAIGLPPTREADAAAALAVLGYTPGEIAAAMRQLDTETMTVEEIIKAVLKNTMRQ